MHQNMPGFDIRVDHHTQILHLRGWGQWDALYAHQVAHIWHARLREISKQDGRWAVLADFQDYYPLSDDVQQIVSRCLRKISPQGIKKVGYLGKAGWLDWKLRDVFATPSPVPCRFFGSCQEAMRWLAEPPDTTT